MSIEPNPVIIDNLTYYYSMGTAVTFSIDHLKMEAKFTSKWKWL